MLLSIVEEEDEVTNNLLVIRHLHHLQLKELMLRLWNLLLILAMLHVVQVRLTCCTLRIIHRLSKLFIKLVIMLLSTDFVVLVNDSFRCYHVMEYSLVKDLVG